MKITLTPSSLSLPITESSRSRFGSREAGCRLVHDDEAGLQRQSLGDLDELPLRERQAGDTCIGTEIGAELLEQWRCLAAQRDAVDQPERPAFQRLAANEDIGGGRQIVEEVEFLMDEGDTCPHRSVDGKPVNLLAVEFDHAAGRLDDAAENFHQGRFAGAVLADQSDHLARRNRKADPVQRPDAGILFTNSRHGQERRGHGRIMPAMKAERQGWLAAFGFSMRPHGSAKLRDKRRAGPARWPHPLKNISRRCAPSARPRTHRHSPCR